MASAFLQVLVVSILMNTFGVLESRAALSNDEVKGVAERLAKIDFVNPGGLNELECGTYRNEKPVHVFAFDGSMGFCPRYFLMNEVGEGGYTDRQNWLDRLSETRVTEHNKKPMSEIAQLLKNEHSFHNCHLAEAVLSRLNGERRLISDQIQFHYYSKGGENSAAECARKISRESSGAARLKVVAYSMGTDSALQFMNANPDIKIEHVVSVDPVGKGARWYTGVFVTQDQDFFERPAQVLRWDNFFQKLDHQSLSKSEYVRLGIRGSRVTGADSNTEMRAVDFEVQPENEFQHVKMLKTQAVQKMIDSLLN